MQNGTSLSVEKRMHGLSSSSVAQNQQTKKKSSPFPFVADTLVS
jgi:hypothetical protein